ncbi:AAA family ATPase [Kocuria palustris]|uniref:AAA family ATPase n=2 Tax=Bacteria TaxID=2 RepID=UPI0021A6C984|nr:AAA family ATPase [Kocuria palustris]MCT1591506.1 AAA family ATPase [Kocuria palustris]
MTSAPALVILRGNSASGKSTIARKVQHDLPRGRIAVIGQDPVRREVLWEENDNPVSTIALTEVMVLHCLSRGRTVILEGIFKVARYGQTFQRLLTGHDGPALVYYLDVSLAETLRRHALKPIAGIVSDDEVASWYVERDTLGVPGEVLLPERISEDALVTRILSDLAALGVSGGAMSPPDHAASHLSP